MNPFRKKLKIHKRVMIIYNCFKRQEIPANGFLFWFRGDNSYTAYAILIKLSVQIYVIVIHI